MASTVLVINLFLPSLRRRRLVAGVFSRFFLRAAGVPFRVEGLNRLPQVPCVVVANHASYIDGLVAAAALPPDFAFVIKKEMVRVPLAGLLLRRLGSQFVERSNRHKGGLDARRVLGWPPRASPWCSFPRAPSLKAARSASFWAAPSRPRRAPTCRWSPWPSTARAPSCPRGALPSSAADSLRDSGGPRGRRRAAAQPRTDRGGRPRAARALTSGRAAAARPRRASGRL